MPLLSILIPTYNSAGTIERCLESIATQTFKDYEVVVQDGSPNDDTAHAIDKFLVDNPNFSVRVHRERDLGVYDAMNKAKAKAEGEWLYFLGSDDELFDSGILASVMTAEITADCDVMYGNVLTVSGEDGGKPGKLWGGKFELSDLFNRNICHQAIFYKSAFARKVGDYEPAYITSADWDFNMRCWAQTRFKYLNVTVAKYHLGGLSSDPHRDKQFNKEFAANAMRYFKLSLLSPLVNAASFHGFHEIIRMQQAKGTLYAFCGRVVRRLGRIPLRMVSGLRRT